MSALKYWIWLSSADVSIRTRWTLIDHYQDAESAFKAPDGEFERLGIKGKELAELEKLGKLKAVITQNIDGLHQAAGSKNVLELHGTLLRAYCCKCKKEHPFTCLYEGEPVPICDCGGIIRPDIVLYEEALNDKVIMDSVRYISQADVLIVGGGIAGILCGYMLKKSGIDCVVVEADRICRGVTGNTTAKITLQHGLIYDKIIINVKYYYK